MTNLNSPSHAILITERHGSYLEPFLKEIFKTIVCFSKINNRFCNACSNCEKVNNNLYFDLIVIDGGRETISKDKIIEIQNRFSHMGLERGNHKIYVIKQIEKGSNQAINSLLKFLEEPPKNTFAVLTTRNESAVPQTILSRCHRFLSSSKNFEWQEMANLYNLTKEDVKVLTSMYWTIDDIIIALKNGTYLEISNLAKRFMKYPKTMGEIKELSEKFKSLSMSDIELILNYILFCVDNRTHQKVLELLEVLSLNPIKNALFWEIICIVEGSGNVK